VLRIHKQGICDEAIDVLSRRLPFGKAPIVKEDRLASSIPVEIVIKRADVPPPAPAAIVPNRLPLYIVDEVATAG